MGTKQNIWAARTSVLARSCVIAVASPRSTGPRFSPFLHHPAPLFHAQMHGLLVLVVFVILGSSSHNALLTCCAGVQKAFLPRPSVCASDPVSAVFFTTNCQLNIDLFTHMLRRVSLFLVCRDCLLPVVICVNQLIGCIIAL